MTKEQNPGLGATSQDRQDFSSDVQPGKSGTFWKWPTHLERVFLKSQDKTPPDILRKTVEEILSLAREYLETQEEVERLEGEQEERHDRLVTITRSHPGLRGLESEPDNLTATISPKSSISWVSAQLRKDLGVLYSACVHEDLLAEITLPAGRETPLGLLSQELVVDAFKKFLIESLGFGEDEVRKILKTDVKPRVDGKTIENWEKEGRVTISEETRRIKTDWQVRVDRLRAQTQTGFRNKDSQST